MTNCPVCGNGSSAREPGFLECGTCGLSFSVDKLCCSPVYKPGLETGIYKTAKEGLFSSALDLLERAFPAGGRLLDVGCAGGELLRAAAAKGWKCEGVELEPALGQKAMSLGFKVYTEPVETAGLEKEAYNAITVFEVFCLMDNPVAAAGELSKLLKPGGMIYIRDFNASFHMPLRRLELLGIFRGTGVMPSVIHSFNFRPKSLRALLEGAGFREIKVRNSRPTSGDPYRTGGRLGGLFTGLLKFLYYTLAQALWYATFGRVYAGSSLIVTARK